MPTKRLALLCTLSLLAACTPRAADTAAGPVAATPPPATAPATAPALPAQATNAAQAAQPDAAAGMPDLDALQRAYAQAGCAVSPAVGELEDIAIYCAMPADVRAFLERENTCQHFAGEEAYDAERRIELEQASAEFCDGREQIFAALLARYQDDCDIRHALVGVGSRYDLVAATDTAPADCRGQDPR